MKKYIIIGFFLTTLILGTIFFLWANQPNEGSFDTNSTKDVLSASKTTEQLQTTLFNTLFDSELRLKTSNQDSNGPIFMQYLLSSKNTRDSNQIGITIGQGEASVEDTAPAKYRLLESSQYQTPSLSFAPVNSLTFSKSSETGYEIAIIWQNKGLYSAVVGSGTLADRTSINEQISDVISNWQWTN